jgi:trk system potassium uptake protein TrkH
MFHDEETRWYVGACLVAGIALSVGLLIHTHMWSSIRIGLFTAVATITSTGFVASDYMVWPPFLWVIVFFLMFTGGASGSTAGGVKWVRIAIFAKSALAELKRRIHPNAVIPVRFNGHTLREQTTGNVMAFMFFYISIIVLATIWFCACGIGFDESLGIAVSMIGNVGVSIGQWGSSGCYAAMPAAAKWAATFVMLIGRLEIFTVLLLFSRALWKK